MNKVKSGLEVSFDNLMESFDRIQKRCDRLEKITIGLYVLSILTFIVIYTRI
jgi:hypothetical protein